MFHSIQSLGGHIKTTQEVSDRAMADVRSPSIPTWTTENSNGRYAHGSHHSQNKASKKDIETVSNR